MASSSMEDTDRGAHHDRLSSPNVSEHTGTVQSEKRAVSESPNQKRQIPAEAHFLKKKDPEEMNSFDSGKDEAQRALKRSQNEPKSRNSHIQPSKPKNSQQIKIVTSFKPGSMSPPRIIGSRSKSIADLDRLYPHKTERRLIEVYPHFDRQPSRHSIHEPHLYDGLRPSVANFVFRGRKAIGLETPMISVSQRNSETKTHKTPHSKAEKPKKVAKLSSGSRRETTNRNLAAKDATGQQTTSKQPTFSKIITRTHQGIDTREMQNSSNYGSNPQLTVQVGESEIKVHRSDSFLSESDLIEEELKISHPTTPILDNQSRIPKNNFSSKSKHDRLLIDQMNDRI